MLLLLQYLHATRQQHNCRCVELSGESAAEEQAVPLHKYQQYSAAAVVFASACSTLCEQL
jgi:hypothetical protein